jgi:hypothetical protein
VERAPLKALHPEGSLSQPKLAAFRKVATEALLASLGPGEPGALKAKPDGTIMDGHHRVCILRERGVDIEALPRETVGGDLPQGGNPYEG